MKYIEKKFKYKTLNIHKRRSVIKKLMITILIGSTLGALFILCIDSINIAKITSLIDTFVAGLNTESNPSFFETLIKNMKYFLFIWFLGFIPFGKIFVWGIVLAKGFGIGFATSIFVHKYSFVGIKYILGIYTLQNIIFIPLILFVSFRALYYCESKNDNKDYLKKYTEVLYLFLIITSLVTLLTTKI